ncbi:TPA: hypothetical protein ACO9GZ_004525, partial [Salmonella enterica subsp. enterica serovar Strathcona]
NISHIDTSPRKPPSQAAPIDIYCNSKRSALNNLPNLKIIFCLADRIFLLASDSFLQNELCSFVILVESASERGFHVSVLTRGPSFFAK